MNFSDSEIVASLMQDDGYEICDHSDKADIIFVNTQADDIVTTAFSKKSETGWIEFPVQTFDAVITHPRVHIRGMYRCHCGKFFYRRYRCIHVFSI